MARNSRRTAIHRAGGASVLALTLGMPPGAAAPAMATGEMPMADYLALLAQIAPAAHAGAQAYLQAFQHRCGRAVPTADLRRAMSEGQGDPVLMAMIRASHLRDATALARLQDQIRCERRGRS